MKLNGYFIFICMLFSFMAQGQFEYHVTNVTCFGDSNGSVQVYPGSGYIYKWSGGDTSSLKSGLKPGFDTCTIFSLMGVPLDTIIAQVSQPPQLSNTFTSTVVSCLGESNGSITIVAAGGTPPYGYSITSSGVNYTADTTGVFDSLPAGQYLVLTGDAHGCSVSDSLTVAQDSTPCYSMGISLAQQVKNISISPNPAADRLQINYELAENVTIHIAIAGLTGKVIREVLTETETKGTHTQSIAVGRLAAGSYLLNITSPRGSINTQFVKL